MDIRIARCMTNGHLVSALLSENSDPMVRLLCERLEAKGDDLWWCGSEERKAREALRAVEINQQY